MPPWWSHFCLWLCQRWRGHHGRVATWELIVVAACSIASLPKYLDSGCLARALPVGSLYYPTTGREWDWKLLMLSPLLSPFDLFACLAVSWLIYSQCRLQTERDVSVRQRAVDLLYAMCDRSNAQQIVAEMLNYLETADYSIREEIVRFLLIWVNLRLPHAWSFCICCGIFLHREKVFQVGLRKLDVSLLSTHCVYMEFLV